VVALPDFLIVGAMRSGTSSLNHYLRQHPQIHMAKQKEVRFFDQHWARGVDWYEEQFDPEPGQICGEASPGYLNSPEAPQRIAQTLPAVRLVAILRNPVDQAYSRYLMAHGRNRNRDRRSFGRAYPDYLPGGQYVDALGRFSATPYVLFTEDLANDPAGEYEGLCAFLGVDESYRPPDLGRVVNQYFEVRSASVRRLAKRLPRRARDAVGRLNHRSADPPAMGQEVRRQVFDHFRPYNERLAQYLGRDLPPEWGS
jgi:hypothetical protein